LKKADPDQDALDAYLAAEERRLAILEVWEEEGRPLTSVGHTGQPVVHPLMKLIAEAEVIADRLRERVRPKRLGREPTAVISPYRSKRITRPKLEAVPTTTPQRKAASTKDG
jgi:hypothetical protein